MKYFFTIHSHITFLSALAVIKYDNLNEKNVVFICSSKYMPPLKKESEIKIIKSFDQVERNYNFFEKIKNINYSRGCDLFINRLSENQKFVAYIDLMSVFNRFLVTNLYCEQFHFIEEGSVNYGNFDDFNLLTMDLYDLSWRLTYKKNFKEITKSIFRIFRGRSLRILNLPIQPNCYAFFKGVNFYGFSEYTFPNIPANKKRITSFSSVKNEFRKDSRSYKDLDNSFIWIGDTAFTFYKISEKHFEDALQKVLTNLKSETHTHIFIKYRGPESKKERMITEEAFKKNNFVINYIDENVVVEDIFMNYSNLKVIGNVSSLLIYAKLMGHSVFSIFKYIPDQYEMPFAKNFKSIHELINK